MALTKDVELRANFLQEAAHLLTAYSPAGAAFLGSARDKLIEDADLELQPKEMEALRRQVCGACGNIMIPGWSCKVSIHSQRHTQEGKRKALPQKSTKADKATFYACARCHRETTQTFPPRSSRLLRKPIAQSDEKPVLDLKKSRHDDSKAPKTVNASSKQRQKARKGGLQAMLEKDKKPSSSPGELDLMDFAM
ncbi:hypothetical protein BKA66DRAFT_408931 [Pyrenochaeta sp. MPI-SDFR-AT-0127]|nr:hypothetical protein BKA66DRAFT_408931 [Pyrenochaeta sp. MPI-SDFR-AT-0127]